MRDAIELRYKNPNGNGEFVREFKQYEGDGFNAARSEMIARAKDKILEGSSEADIFLVKRITGYKAQIKRNVVVK
jgi:hypothetical protein